MVSQLWIQSTRPAFLLWASFWIVVCVFDTQSTKGANLFSFFALFLGMMVGHAMNEIRNIPISWHLPGQQRSLVIFFLVHSLVWTMVATFFVESAIIETYGFLPIWMLIYFWFVIGATIRYSPSLLVPTSFLTWFLYIALSMWPLGTLNLATTYTTSALLAWLVIVVWALFWVLRRETHRLVLDGPFMSLYNSFDEKQVKTFREALVTQRATDSRLWKQNLANANFITWLRAVFYENMGFFNLRSLAFNLLLVVGGLVMVISVMSIQGLNQQVFSHFALFWMCMTVAIEYPLNLSPNLLYPFNRQRRGLLSFSLRFVQFFLVSIVYLALAMLSQLIPPFEFKLESGFTIQWITLETPMIGVLLTFTMMPIYYMLALVIDKCKYAFVIMMFTSGLFFGFMRESEHMTFLEWLYQNHCLSLMAISMTVLWLIAHLYIYRIRDVST